MIADHLDLVVHLGADTLRVVPATPIEEAELAAAERKRGWPLPADYRACLLAYGAVDVLGARLLHPDAWGARMEPLVDANGEPRSTDPLGPMACHLPFAVRDLPTGGELVFCFRFELSLRDSARELAAVSAGEARPPFLGSPYAVVACLLPEGRAGARFEASQRPMAATFDQWVEQVVALVKSRAAAAR